MAVTKQNARVSKSKTGARSRNHAEKFTRRASSNSVAQAASATTSRAVRKTWNRAKQQARRILSRAGTSSPSDGDLPMRGQIVLLDACNVGYFHSNHSKFSAEGVRFSIQYFYDRGFEAYGMLPKFRLKPGKSTDWRLLDMLYQNGRLIATPCKEFPVRGMCYDDRFMLEIGRKFNCAVVSNDRYRDIMHEQPGWAEYIMHNRFEFEWSGNSFSVQSIS